MMSRLRQASAKAKPGEVNVGSGGWNARDFPEKRGPVMTVPEEKVNDLHPLATHVGAHRLYAKAGGGF
jgi:hypothetical protein